MVVKILLGILFFVFIIVLFASICSCAKDIGECEARIEFSDYITKALDELDIDNSNREYSNGYLTAIDTIQRLEREGRNDRFGSNKISTLQLHK